MVCSLFLEELIVVVVFIDFDCARFKAARAAGGKFASTDAHDVICKVDFQTQILHKN